jgi:hypothetical protein
VVTETEYAASLAFRTRVDRSVCLDGYRRMASLALRGIPRQSHRALVVSGTTRTKRPLDLVLLCLASRTVGIRRHCATLGPYCCHPPIFLARAPFCGHFPHAVSVVGQFRICPQLFCLAAQSTSSGLVACCLTIYSSRTRFAGRVNSDVGRVRPWRADSEWRIPEPRYFRVLTSVLNAGHGGNPCLHAD